MRIWKVCKWHAYLLQETKLCRWEKTNRFHFIYFKCQNTCSTVLVHLLFRSTNTDGEVSHCVRGEMKCNLMLNTEAVLSLHSYSFIPVWHSQICLGCYTSSAGDTLCVWGGNTWTDIIYRFPGIPLCFWQSEKTLIQMTPLCSRSKSQHWTPSKSFRKITYFLLCFEWKWQLSFIYFI